jgi:hypothetical protein
MASAYVPPVISVSYDADEGKYVLMATSHARTAPAGVRMFRAEPWPEVQFQHDDEAPALRDAAVLRHYLDECASGKRQDKEDAPRKRGWWED